MSCHFLPQGILPTQGSNPSLLHQQWILYQLNRQGSLRKPQFTWLSKLHTLEQTSYCPKRTFSLPATISGQPASHPEFLACLSISGLRWMAVQEVRQFSSLGTHLAYWETGRGAACCRQISLSLFPLYNPSGKWHPMEVSKPPCWIWPAIHFTLLSTSFLIHFAYLSLSFSLMLGLWWFSVSFEIIKFMKAFSKL